MLWRSGDFTLTKFLRELAVREGDRRPRPELWPSGGLLGLTAQILPN